MSNMKLNFKPLLKPLSGHRRALCALCLSLGLTAYADAQNYSTASSNYIQTSQSATYMPAENDLHEGTWLQWPHAYTYGARYRNRLDATWVSITEALVQSENVHIIAYDNREKQRITRLLSKAGVPLENVDFTLRATDDTWVRDNGPIFVFDENNAVKVADFGFNGWGYDTPYKKDNSVPYAVAKKLGLPRIDLSEVVLEGGSVEIDGNGTLLATRSAILERNRNPGLSQYDVEQVLSHTMGVSKFIWLDGKDGGQEDITDTHIDGFARFGDENTLVTMSPKDLRYWGLSGKDIKALYAASDIDGNAYDRLQLPLTKRNVVSQYGKRLGYKGSYVNYYVANTVVLMPAYNDPNDNVARDILQSLYPERTVVSIDVRNLYVNGGMLHCVTQQQPSAQGQY